MKTGKIMQPNNGLGRIGVANQKWNIILFQIFALFLVFSFHIKEIKLDSLLFGLGLIVATLISVTIIQKFTSGDPYLIVIVNMIFTIGIIMIYRMEAALGEKQLIIYVISVIAFLLTYLFFKKTYKFWMNKTLFFYILTVALFVITLAFGIVTNGAKNWIDLGFTTIQPSEFAKIFFVLYLASWYMNYEKHQKNLITKLSLMIGVYLLIGMFFLQRELGTAVVFFVVLLISQIAYEKNWWLIIINVATAVLGMIAAYYLFAHIRVRFEIWIDPWQDANDKGYQIIQALFAIAEGRFFGTGIGLGKPGHIPLGYSDFIFASIIEEMGTFMGICIILLFLLLIYRGINIAMKQERDYFSVLALTVSMIYMSQALIMFAGVLKLIPLTGITIPFLTYGGSSLLSSFIMLAILQACSEEYN